MITRLLCYTFPMISTGDIDLPLIYMHIKMPASLSVRLQRNHMNNRGDSIKKLKGNLNSTCNPPKSPRKHEKITL